MAEIHKKASKDTFDEVQKRQLSPEELKAMYDRFSKFKSKRIGGHWITSEDIWLNEQKVWTWRGEKYGFCIFDDGSECASYHEAKRLWQQYTDYAEKRAFAEKKSLATYNEVYGK